MPRKTFFVKASVFILGIVVMDLCVSQIAKRIAPQWRNSVLEQDARILVNPYHHGLKPYAEFVHKYGLYLPNHANLNNSDIDYISRCFKSIAKPIFF